LYQGRFLKNDEETAPVAVSFHDGGIRLFEDDTPASPHYPDRSDRKDLTGDGEVDIARQWRLRTQRYRLTGEVCPVCKRKLFPPRHVCPHCAAGALSGRAQSGDRAAIHGVNVSAAAPAPHTMALLTLADGVHVVIEDGSQFRLVLAGP
jgi:hypothetical protein